MPCLHACGSLSITHTYFRLIFISSDFSYILDLLSDIIIINFIKCCNKWLFKMLIYNSHPHSFVFFHLSINFPQAHIQVVGTVLNCNSSVNFTAFLPAAI